jgi:predicted metalloprotease with PDZ domain
MIIRYAVRASEPAEHRGRFSIELADVREPEVDLVLPSWVPGSYHLVNYVRGFRGMSARASPDGPALPVDRVDKTRWRIRTGGAGTIRVEYTVYGHEMVTEAFDLSPEHLFVNAALCLPYVDGHQTEPVEVELDVPDDWRVVTELEPVGSAPNRFRAPDYDTLVDEPIDAGHPVVLTIRPGGIPHRISLCGEGGNYDAHRLEEDLGKIVDATTRLFGDSPLKSYTFFYHLTDVSDGGLEHANSNSCVVPRTTFAPAEDYLHFLGLTSHEYFHLYNVKRIRPKVLGPFDYTREVYTRLLWWMEGATDYFSDLVLRRAGLYSAPKFLAEQAKLARQYLDTPGRRAMSLEESSFLAWVDHYQPFEESPNQSVSYYLKGGLVAMCLDLEIRHRTETRASLETVLKTLWTEYGRVGRGLEEEELLPVANRATGLELAPFFARYVRGTEEVDLDAFARYAGLAFGPKPKPADDDSPEPGYLGLRLENSGGLPRVRSVLLDTPGRHAGLTPGDEIVAVNGSRATFEKFEKTMARYPPGTPVDLAIFRRGFLRHVRLTTGTPPPEKYAFTPDAAASDLARKVYEGWVGVPWEPPAVESTRSASGAGRPT